MRRLTAKRASGLMALALWLAPLGAADAEATPTPSIASADGASTVTSEPQASPTPSFFDVNKYRADPGNPGVIRIPGTNVAIYIGGFAQLDVIDDINVIGNQTSSWCRRSRSGAARATRGLS